MCKVALGPKQPAQPSQCVLVCPCMSTHTKRTRGDTNIQFGNRPHTRAKVGKMVANANHLTEPPVRYPRVGTCILWEAPLPGSQLGDSCPQHSGNWIRVFKTPCPRGQISPIWEPDFSGPFQKGPQGRHSIPAVVECVGRVERRHSAQTCVLSIQDAAVREQPAHTRSQGNTVNNDELLLTFQQIGAPNRGESGESAPIWEKGRELVESFGATIVEKRLGPRASSGQCIGELGSH